MVLVVRVFVLLLVLFIDEVCAFIADLTLGTCAVVGVDNIRCCTARGQLWNMFAFSVELLRFGGGMSPDRFSHRLMSTPTFTPAL